jgi:putative acetyltransferase
MRDDLVIRRERPGDALPTEVLHDLAFPVSAERGESLERRLVRGLRADGAVIDGLTFVAELDGEVVGHVVCSRARLGEGPSVGLGPIAVHPDHQRQGIGAALVMAVVASAERMGEPAVVLLGDPDYYGFFGFVPASRHGIIAPGPWADAFQVLTLRAWRPQLAGDFRYPAAFDRLL